MRVRKGQEKASNRVEHMRVRVPDTAVFSLSAFSHSSGDKISIYTHLRQA